MLVITQDVDLTCCHSDGRFWLGLFLSHLVSAAEMPVVKHNCFVQLGWVELERTIERGLETRWHLLKVIEQVDVRVTDESRVSQAQHYWYFKLDDSLLWGAVMWFVGCLEASLASTYQIHSSPLICDNEKCLYTLPNVSWDTAVPSNEILD